MLYNKIKESNLYQNCNLNDYQDSFVGTYVDNCHCKYLNARSECNDIIYSHYPLDLNAKSSDTKCVTLSI